MIKETAREAIFKIPGTRKFWSRWINGKLSRHQFVGWGMTTDTTPPWKGDVNELGREFLETHNKVLSLVESGKFKLSQFDNVKDARSLLEGLMWRHFVVFWSARFSMLAQGDAIVECGVCDGLTVFFAIAATNNSRTAWLYDAWEGMKPDRLLASEKSFANDYAYLDIEQTKKNLAGLKTEFVKGYIPDSFKNRLPKGTATWLHIDLNASAPTMDSLKEFFPKMPAGGVILFDDYAGKGFAETRKAIDAFFKDKRGQLLHMPTGQAVFFKV